MTNQGSSSMHKISIVVNTLGHNRPRASNLTRLWSSSSVPEKNWEKQFFFFIDYQTLLNFPFPAPKWYKKMHFFSLLHHWVCSTLKILNEIHGEMGKYFTLTWCGSSFYCSLLGILRFSFFLGFKNTDSSLNFHDRQQNRMTVTTLQVFPTLLFFCKTEKSWFSLLPTNQTNRWFIYSALSLSLFILIFFEVIIKIINNFLRSKFLK